MIQDKQNRSFVLTLIFSLCSVCVAQKAVEAQTKLRPRLILSHSEEFMNLVQTLKAQSCIHDLPAPTLLQEPKYTIGTTNSICFQLPSSETIPFSADTVKSPFVITLLDDGSGATPLEFPRPVDLEDNTIQFETIAALEAGVRYGYTTALFLPVCTIECAAVSDTSQLELHCSAYQDTVFSTQDTSAPSVQSVLIPQLANSSVAGWSNQSRIAVAGQIVDPAGVWQGRLYRRSCSESGWSTGVADTTYPGSSGEFGFVFSESAGFSVQQTLADGCYEFRIEGKDATHTPESCFPNFELAGNGGTPEPDAEPHVRINIDTTPPSSVSLSCEQVLNTIRLNWTASVDPAPGIGLSGYRIYRNGSLLNTVSGSETSYVDTFPPSTPDSDFVYQIQPFDSLENVQTNGGSSDCLFTVVSQVVMLQEPEYTAGTTNLLCWTGSPNIVSFTVFAAEDCDYANASQFTLMDTCYSFTDLQDGANYCYWVRAVDQQQRIVFSDTVQSRQDAQVPQISSLNLLEKRVLGSTNWTTSRELQIRITASDAAPGFIEKLELFEDGVVGLSPVMDDRADDLDLTLPYTLAGNECEAIELSARVTDAAGNESALHSLTIRLDQTPPESVTNLNCVQLVGANGIRLDWTAVNDPGACSGLAGYHILRNGTQIASTSRSTLSFEDTLPANTPSGQFTYEIHPFDSVGNVQIAGVVGTCDYIGTSSITLEPLEKFTPGVSREICSQVTGTLLSLTLFLDENCDSVADDSVLIANPGNQLCHSFDQLVDGREYCYWGVGLDEQQRVVRSDTVRSIQDNSTPVVDLVEFPEADTLNGELWVYDSEVQVRFLAHDTAPGEIWYYEILENGQSSELIALTDPGNQIDEVIRYSWITPIDQLGKIELAVRVIDGAGNTSELRSLHVNVQEALPRMFAFPNPFNPVQARVTIRLDDPNETEVGIYDFFGNFVITLTAKVNSRDFVWDGRNGKGEMVASGGYICVGKKTRSRFKVGVMKQGL